MVDRINQNKEVHEYWKIDPSSEMERDRGQQQDQNPSSPYDKTDWQLLFDKSRLWKRNIQILVEEIDQVLFRKINLKTDPSLLRVDIILKGGNRIAPAFVAISRAHGLKIKNMTAGQVIPLTELVHENSLRVTVPTNPELFAEEETKVGAPQPSGSLTHADDTTKVLNMKKVSFWQLKDPQTGHIKPEIVILYGVSIFLVTLLIMAVVFLF